MNEVGILMNLLFQNEEIYTNVFDLMYPLIDNTMVSECSICSHNPCKMLQFECSHIFCKGCVGSWLKVKAREQKTMTCPLCRKVIFVFF